MPGNEYGGNNSTSPKCGKWSIFANQVTYGNPKRTKLHTHKSRDTYSKIPFRAHIHVVGIYRQLQRHVHTDSTDGTRHLHRTRYVHAMLFVRGPTQNEIRVHGMRYVCME